MMVLGDRIKQRRLELNMTQQELGDKIAVSKVAICSYEKNTRTPKLDTLSKIAEVLNLEVGYLLGQDVNIVSEENNLSMKLPKEDLKLLSELKKNKKLYLALINDPKRMIQLINNKLSK
ncbi:MAG: helix-turn-helix transcriptional regulator [Bacilli bacterium]|nr:helix-turn-helix transcriptional regulator [Bacilli bacterium]